MGKKKMNLLNGSTWIKYSISVWDIKKSTEESKLGHPAMFPVELCNRLIEIYTVPGETVLDPFIGSGSTLISAKGLARKGIGFEINKDYIGMAHKRITKVNWGTYLKKQSIKQSTLSGESHAKSEVVFNEKDIPPESEPIIFEESCMNITSKIKANSVDFILTSPPYWDIHRQKRTADYKKSRPYSDLEEDIGNISKYEDFIHIIGDMFAEFHKVLRRGKYCAIIVMDLRKKNKFYPFHSDIANEFTTRGFELEDIIIWNRAKEYNNLRALGYPTVFRVNKIHEYILLFSKR